MRSLNQTKVLDRKKILLHRIIVQAKLMAKKKSGGYRYEDKVLLDFALNSYLLGGRKFYEVMCSNFPGVFPYVRTVQRTLKKFDNSAPEGQLNIGALKKYLVENNLPLVGTVSEDCTAIVGRREYDSRSNRVLGFSLPLQQDGLRNPEASIVKNAADIARLFQTLPRASVILVVMFQPLADTPPLRVFCCASDNRFTTEDVKARMMTIEAALAKEGITMLTYSADGDSREMKWMRELLQLGFQLPESIKFCIASSCYCFIL